MRSDRKVRDEERSCAVERRYIAMRETSLILFSALYGHDEVAVRPKRRLCTTSA